MTSRCFRAISALLLLIAYGTDVQAFLALPYLPVKKSITWTYQEGTSIHTAELNLIDDSTFLGAPPIGFVLGHNGNDGISFQYPPATVSAVLADDPVLRHEYLFLSPSFKLANANITLGETVVSTGAVNVTREVSVNSVSGTYTATSRPVGFETVTTPLGTFHALRFDHTLNTSLIIDGRPVTSTRASRSWFTSGIGLVKNEISANGGPPTVAVLIGTNIAGGSPDTLPNTLFFTAAASRPSANSEVTSNAVAISGINVGVTTSITGGSYSINGGPFISEPGIANNGDTVAVRVTASPSPGETACATLNVGAGKGQFCAKDVSLGSILPFLTILLE